MTSRVIVAAIALCGPTAVAWAPVTGGSGKVASRHPWHAPSRSSSRPMTAALDSKYTLGAVARKRLAPPHAAGRARTPGAPARCPKRCRHRPRPSPLTCVALAPSFAQQLRSLPPHTHALRHRHHHAHTHRHSTAAADSEFEYNYDYADTYGEASSDPNVAAVDAADRISKLLDAGSATTKKGGAGSAGARALARSDEEEIAAILEELPVLGEKGKFNAATRRYKKLMSLGGVADGPAYTGILTACAKGKIPQVRGLVASGGVACKAGQGRAASLDRPSPLFA